MTTHGRMTLVGFVVVHRPSNSPLDRNSIPDQGRSWSQAPHGIIVKKPVIPVTHAHRRQDDVLGSAPSVVPSGTDTSSWVKDPNIFEAAPAKYSNSGQTSRPAITVNVDLTGDHYHSASNSDEDESPCYSPTSPDAAYREKSARRKAKKLRKMQARLARMEQTKLARMSAASRLQLSLPLHRVDVPSCHNEEAKEQEVVHESVDDDMETEEKNSPPINQELTTPTKVDEVDTTILGLQPQEHQKVSSSDLQTSLSAFTKVDISKWLEERFATLRELANSNMVLLSESHLDQLGAGPALSLPTGIAVHMTTTRAGQTKTRKRKADESKDKKKKAKAKKSSKKSTSTKKESSSKKKSSSKKPSSKKKKGAKPATPTKATQSAPKKSPKGKPAPASEEDEEDGTTSEEESSSEEEDESESDPAESESDSASDDGTEDAASSTAASEEEDDGAKSPPKKKAKKDPPALNAKDAGMTNAQIKAAKKIIKERSKTLEQMMPGFSKLKEGTQVLGAHLVQYSNGLLDNKVAVPPNVQEALQSIAAQAAKGTIVTKKDQQANQLAVGILKHRGVFTTSTSSNTINKAEEARLAEEASKKTLGRGYGKWSKRMLHDFRKRGPTFAGLGYLVNSKPSYKGWEPEDNDADHETGLPFDPTDEDGDESMEEDDDQQSDEAAGDEEEPSEEKENEDGEEPEEDDEDEVDEEMEDFIAPEDSPITYESDNMDSIFDGLADVPGAKDVPKKKKSKKKTASPNKPTPSKGQANVTFKLKKGLATISTARASHPSAFTGPRFVNMIWKSIPDHELNSAIFNYSKRIVFEENPNTRMEDFESAYDSIAPPNSRFIHVITTSESSDADGSRSGRPNLPAFKQNAGVSPIQYIGRFNLYVKLAKIPPKMWAAHFIWQISDPATQSELSKLKQKSTQSPLEFFKRVCRKFVERFAPTAMELRTNQMNLRTIKKGIDENFEDWIARFQTGHYLAHPNRTLDNEEAYTMFIAATSADLSRAAIGWDLSAKKGSKPSRGGQVPVTSWNTLISLARAYWTQRNPRDIKDEYLQRAATEEAERRARLHVSGDARFAELEQKYSGTFSRSLAESLLHGATHANPFTTPTLAPSTKKILATHTGSGQDHDQDHQTTQPHDHTRRRNPPQRGFPQRSPAGRFTGRDQHTQSRDQRRTSHDARDGTNVRAAFNNHNSSSPHIGTDDSRRNTPCRECCMDHAWADCPRNQNSKTSTPEALKHFGQGAHPKSTDAQREAIMKKFGAIGITKQNQLLRKNYAEGSSSASAATSSNGTRTVAAITKCQTQCNRISVGKDGERSVVLPCLINLIPVEKALIDTGSCCSFVSEAFFYQYLADSVDLESPPEFSVHVADGSKASIVGRITVSVTFTDSTNRCRYTQPHEFIVMKGLTNSVLGGMDLLTKFFVQVEFINGSTTLRPDLIPDNGVECIRNDHDSSILRTSSLTEIAPFAKKYITVEYDARLNAQSAHPIICEAVPIYNKEGEVIQLFFPPVLRSREHNIPSPSHQWSRYPLLVVNSSAQTIRLPTGTTVGSAAVMRGTVLPLAECEALGNINLDRRTIRIGCNACLNADRVLKSLTSGPFISSYDECACINFGKAMAAYQSSQRLTTAVLGSLLAKVGKYRHIPQQAFVHLLHFRLHRTESNLRSITACRAVSTRDRMEIDSVGNNEMTNDSSSLCSECDHIYSSLLTGDPQLELTHGTPSLTCAAMTLNMEGHIDDDTLEAMTEHLCSHHSLDDEVDANEPGAEGSF
jgi:hypothetical protein